MVWVHMQPVNAWHANAQTLRNAQHKVNTCLIKCFGACACVCVRCVYVRCTVKLAPVCVKYTVAGICVLSASVIR
jgi:hypothetical protein